MKTTNYGWVLLIALFISANTKAQSDSARENDRPHFRLGVFYNTHLNYYGRTDSLHSGGFFPIAEFWFKNFYINAAPVFVNNNVTRFDYAGTVATAGYHFSVDNKFAGNVYFVKPIYESNSQLVQSALKDQFAVTLTRINKIINVTAGGDVKFSDKTDYGVTAGLDHIFRIELPGTSVLVINPSAYLNAGTQQFTKTYYKESSFLFFPGLNQAVTENAQNFNILSYEISVPVIYAKGKWQLLLIPAYIIPQNIVMVPGRPDISETGKKAFYATVGAKVNF